MRYLRLVHSVPLSRASVDDGPPRSGERPISVQDTAKPDGEASRPEGGRRKLERDGRPFDPAVPALLQRVRIMGPLPRAVRERALARARAALAVPACATARPPPRHRRPWLTLLVSVTLAAVVGAAVETLLARRAAGIDQPSHAAAPLRIAAD